MCLRANAHPGLHPGYEYRIAFAQTCQCAKEFLRLNEGPAVASSVTSETSRMSANTRIDFDDASQVVATSINRSIMRTLAAAFAICLGMSAPAWSQIKIGQTAGMTGAVASSVKEATQGAKLYLDSVNARGGLNGEAVQLISLDDKFDPKLAVTNAQELIDQGVVAR